MRWFTLVGLVVAACIAGPADAAGGKTVSIPLPAPQAASIVTFTVIGHGNGPLRVSTANDSALGNLALVYAIGKPKKTGATSTWTVAVLIKRFTAQRRAAGTPGGTVTVHVDYLSDEHDFRISRYIPAKCPEIAGFDTGFEGGAAATLGGLVYTLSNGRTPGEQPSPPEEVMDNIIATITSCPNFTPEGDDPGNK